MNLQIKKLTPEATLPKRMTPGSSGYDLFSSSLAPIVLKPGDTAVIPTGLAFSLPVGYEGEIRPRSGLAMQHSIGIMNAPGTIDQDYRGEIKVLLHNFGREDFIVHYKDRIAQVIFHKYACAKFEIVEELDATSRGTGGFGHTLINKEVL